MNLLFYQLLLFVLCSHYALIQSISSGANEPIPDNELGMTTRDCSLQFCESKDSLGLWLSLQNVCLRESANPYFLEHVAVVEESYGETLSPFTSGTVCAFVAVVSFFLGYMISAKNENRKDRIEEYKI